MNQFFNQAGTATRAIDRATFDAGLRQHMLRVYNFMGLGLALTGAVAFATANIPALYNLIFGSPLMWLVMLAPLGFIFYFSYNFHRASASKLQTLFWVFCGLMGLSMASIFVVFTGADIARAFFITAAMFGGTSLYGYTTKRDLTGMGAFMAMGLIGLIIASLVNIFLASSALQWAVSVAGVVIFTGLAAYDTQRIKEQYSEGHGVEANTKLAVMGALSLYLDFINLFQMLLSLLGGRRE
ncbi:MAG: Bax inhibitor-1 family protein [Bdellovibrionales bacterium]